MKIMAQIVKNPFGLTGLILVLFWLIIAILAPIISPARRRQDPYIIARVGLSSVPKPPSKEAPFGTASGGSDILYGIVWGSRTAFRTGIIVVCACALIGFFLGGLGAFIEGIADAIAVRVTNLFMSFPFLIAVIILSVLLGKGIDNVIIALIVFGWRSYARIMHSKVLSVKEQVFVTAAESIGAGKLRIFFRYILPNSICPVFILMLLDLGTMVLIATSLSFIGVGAKPGYADWGQMIYSSRDWLLGTMSEPFHYWYTYMFPFIAIFTFVLGWNLLGETLRDVLDPKIQREPR